MSRNGKLIAVAVGLSLLAILSGLLFGREKIPQIRDDMEVWVSREDQNILYHLPEDEALFLSEILSHQRKTENGDQYGDFVLAFAAYQEGEMVLQPSLYRLSDGTNEFVMKYPNGSCYLLDTRSVLQLLTSGTVDNLFDYIEDAPTLTVTAGDQSLTVHCTENGWQYKKIDNSIFMDGVIVQDEQTLLEPEADQSLSLQFSTQPQSVQVEMILSSAGETVFSGGEDRLDQFQPPVSGLYEMRVTAEWTETQSRRYSGRCVYTLQLQITKETQVKVSQRQVQQGGLLEVWVTDPQDPASMRVMTELGRAGSFVQQGEGSYACLVAASQAGSAPLVVLSREAGAEHQLTVTAVESEQLAEPFPFAVENGEEEESAQSLAAVWQNCSLEQTAQKYWNGVFQLPVSDAPDLVFGQSFAQQPEQMAGTNWWQIQEQTQVVAANAGVVAFAGVLDQGGFAIAVDHGLGLYTWYYGLSQSDVQQGDRVSKGETIGTVVLSDEEPAWFGAQAVLSGVPLDWERLMDKAWLEP